MHSFFYSMQTNLLWTGQEYRSSENCIIKTNATANDIRSVIIGKYEENIFDVSYQIKTHQNWETVFLELHSRIGNQSQHIQLESDGKSNWKMDGKKATQFDGCIDIDISLTPLTNTLPINRLQLKPGEEQQIRVIYIDVLAQQIKPVLQKYIRLSGRVYRYENVPNDFEAKISVDEQGFVVDYPPLFVSTKV